MVKAFRSVALAATTVAPTPLDEKTGEEGVEDWKDPFLEEEATEDEEDKFQLCEEDTLQICKEKSLHHIRCFAHTLDLVAAECSRNKDFLELMMSVRRLIASINRSGPAKERLKQLSQRSLPSYCPTRWSINYLLLKAVSSLREPVETICKESTINCLKNSKWEDVASCTELLAEVSNQTHLCEAENYTTLSLVIPALCILKEHFTEVCIHFDSSD